MKPIRLFVLLSCCLFLGGGARAQTDGELRIGSTGLIDTRIPIAVPSFVTDDPALSAIAREMAQVVANDLAFSGLFVLLPASQYPAGFVALESDAAKLDLNTWAATKAEHLVYGKVLRRGDTLLGQCRLFDLFGKEQVKGMQIPAPMEKKRLMAHTFSEEIIRQLDGIPGIGTTEICFSAGRTGKKELYVADYDGANARQITKHNSISINPQLSPDGTKIAYMSYKDRYAYLYILERASGRTYPLSKEVGLNSAPAWAPDGRTLAMTLSKDGNAEIYTRNVDGLNPRRLTKNKHNDTSPTFSPDGKRIAWVADIGRPQIYVMNVDGTGAKRLSYQGGNSYDPAWSPDGKKIAYVVESNGQGLEIYVMDADGRNPRRLTDTHGSNEAPCWSPDSRHVVFTSSRSGTKELWYVNPESGDSHPFGRMSLRCEAPTWGPRRK